ncbi:MAG: DUF4340 domain-containing protein [Bacteroidetes bacterium]|jgi:hypothetical protein|nr:DUF4340 domain-containing protein [Bacteroidota bacterium]
MKRNRIALLVFILLAAVTAWLWFGKSSTSLKGELRDFAVADTAVIDKIFLADKDGHSATITRVNPDTWLVNNKYIARKDAVDNLLYTIKAVEVRSPVGKNLYNNTMKLMAAKSVKIEIYEGQKILKTYYVGHPTMDNLGTFMYLENSTVPFITHIPGFNGFLSSRYISNEAEWRDKAIFRIDPRTITDVLVRDFLRPHRSFELKRQADSSYTVTKLEDKTPVKPLDVTKVRTFLSAFRDTYFERLDHAISKKVRDSVLAAGSFSEIRVRMEDGKEKMLTCFRKPVSQGSRLQIDFEGKDLPFDYDRFYAIMTGDTSMLVCQYFHFDRIFKDPRNFLPGKDIVPAQQRFE